MLDERHDAADNEPIEEVDNVQIGDVVVDRVGFKDAKKALVTLRQFLKQKPTDVTPLIHSIQTLQKEIGFWCSQEFHQTTIGLFFHCTSMYDGIHRLCIFNLYLYK